MSLSVAFNNVRRKQVTFTFLFSVLAVNKPAYHTLCMFGLYFIIVPRSLNPIDTLLSDNSICHYFGKGFYCENIPAILFHLICHSDLSIQGIPGVSSSKKYSICEYQFSSLLTGPPPHGGYGGPPPHGPPPPGVQGREITSIQRAYTLHLVRVLYEPCYLSQILLYP